MFSLWCIVNTLYYVSGGASIAVSDCSNSSWAEMESYVIGGASIFPLSIGYQQVLILRYLTPMGEYQEVRFGHIYGKTPVKYLIGYLCLWAHHRLYAYRPNGMIIL